MCSSITCEEFEYIRKIVSNVIQKENTKDFSLELMEKSIKENNLLGEICHVQVNSKEKNDRLNLIVKMAPKYERDLIPVVAFYKREIYTYETILPLLIKLQEKHSISLKDRFVPVKFYGGDLTPFKENLVLEDMNPQNFFVLNKVEPLDYMHLMLVVKNLSMFHALCFSLKKEQSDVFQEITENICQGAELTENYKQFIQIAMDSVIKEIKNDDHKAKIENFKEVAFEKFKLCANPEVARPYSVLCHSDCWSNNMLFKYEENKPSEMRFIDWQLIREGSPVLDIVSLIFCNTDESFRAEYYVELLNYYYENLKNNLLKLECDVNECFPESIYKEHMKIFSPYGFIMASLILPIFLSEVDGGPGLDDILKKDTLDDAYFKYKLSNEATRERYIQRMQGLVKHLIDLEDI